MQVTRQWCMPNANTFAMKPIENLLKELIQEDMVVIDPFARDSKFGTITNDINPKTKADYHLDAHDFADVLIEKKVKADVILFDPPYSPRQLKEVYDNIGRKFTQIDGQIVTRWGDLKRKLMQSLKPKGLVISFGWNSAGFGKKNGFEIEQILLLSHGAGHNDTIITIERKL